MNNCMVHFLTIVAFAHIYPLYIFGQVQRGSKKGPSTISVDIPLPYTPSTGIVSWCFMHVIFFISIIVGRIDSFLSPNFATK